MAATPGPRFLRLAVVATMLCIAPRPGSGATWHVIPAGGGDATTIAGGLALASAGDHVIVAAGTYLEHELELVPGVELASESGPLVTIIDAELLGYGVVGADQATMRGFTIQRAAYYAVYCYQTSPAILDNIIEENSGRGITLYQSTSLIQGNTVRSNPAFPPTTDAILAFHSSPHIVQNTIEVDDPDDHVYAIAIGYTGPTGVGVVIEENTIIGRLYLANVNGPGASVIQSNVVLGPVGGGGGMNVTACAGPLSFHHNTLVRGLGVRSVAGSVFTFDNNIVTGVSTGIESTSGTVTLDCNDFWNNQTNYINVSPGPNDLSTDPQFCDSAAGDYHISTTSPCADANSPAGCALVGALPPTCAVVPAVLGTWGQVKVRYR